MASKPDLVLFFEGGKGDYRNRSLSKILEWSDKRLEDSHDYIQTLFPLPEASGVNWNAPLIDRNVFEAFHSQPQLRENLRTAFTRMLSFYGFKWSEEARPMKIVLAGNFELAARRWVDRFDHNHLRITRIIRSLRVLGLEEEALAFFQVLKWVQERSNISTRSLKYWTRAAYRPLYIAPDVDEIEEDRVPHMPAFLREFEETRQQHLAQKEQSNGNGDRKEKKSDEILQDSNNNGKEQDSKIQIAAQINNKAVDGMKTKLDEDSRVEEGAKGNEKDVNAVKKTTP